MSSAQPAPAPFDRYSALQDVAKVREDLGTVAAMARAWEHLAANQITVADYIDFTEA